LISKQVQTDLWE